MVETGLVIKPRRRFHRRRAAGTQVCLIVSLLCAIFLCRNRVILDLAFVSFRSPRRIAGCFAEGQHTASSFTSLEVLRTSVFKPGQILDGKVKAIIDTGLVVQIGPNQTGFVHVSEIAHGYTNHPTERFRVDAEITVMVQKHEPGFLSLSVRKVGKKSLLGDFLVGQKVQGIVKATVTHGAWVNIGATRDAYLSNCNIKLPKEEDDCDNHVVQDAREHLQAGDKITAWVRTKEKPNAPGAEGSLTLTMIESEAILLPARIMTGLSIANLQEGEELGGYVRAVKDKVCFVSVGAEVDGILRMRNINDGIFTDMHKVMKLGDKVVVKLRRLRIAEKKLELELVGTPKRLPAVASLAPLESKSVWLEGIVSGKAGETWRRGVGRDGVLVNVRPPGGKVPVTGLLMRRDFAFDSGGDQQNAKSVRQLEEGDKIKVRILKVDIGKKQVLLSTKISDSDSGLLSDDLEAPQTGASASEMLALLIALDPRVSEADYFDSATGQCDFTGLQEDLQLAQSTFAASKGKDPETLLAEFSELNPGASKENYWDEGNSQWDLESLQEDMLDY